MKVAHLSTDPSDVGHSAALPEEAGAYADLVERARCGDDAAWAVLVKEFTPLIRGVARRFRLTDSDVADVVQTVWLRLAQNIASIHDGDRVRGWLATTARREAMRLVRRREVPADPELMDLPPDDSTPEHVVVEAEDRLRITQAMRRLPERDQRLLTLLTAEECPRYDRVATQLRMPVGSIGPTRGRALSRLRREFDRVEPAQVVRCR
jgi:RNA polymerase sigma factor (sigma-70 family)